MKGLLLVFAGAGLGGVARHAVNLACGRWCGPEFPWSTLIVNATGSLAMGLVAGWLAFRANEAWGHGLQLFIATGVLGGFTTFSAFSLDAILLWERGAAPVALLYVLVSVVLSILGLACGLYLVRSFS